MLKKTLQSLLFTLLCICHFTAFANTKILVLGDSISAAHGFNSDQGWVYLLEKKLKQENEETTVINASISGETTVGGVNRLPNILAEHKPTIIILELGGNDGLRGYPLHIIKENLENMIKMAQKEGAKVILAGMRIPPNYGKQYTEQFHQIYEDLAKEYDTALIPFLLEGVGDQSKLMQTDGIHPNAEAQEIILKNAWPVVLSRL